MESQLFGRRGQSRRRMSHVVVDEDRQKANRVRRFLPLEAQEGQEIPALERRQEKTRPFGGEGLRARTEEAEGIRRREKGTAQRPGEDKAVRDVSPHPAAQNANSFSEGRQEALQSRHPRRCVRLRPERVERTRVADEQGKAVGCLFIQVKEGTGSRTQ